MFTVYLSCLNLSATPASPAAVDGKDDKQPYTDGWSFTIDQSTPWQGLLEVTYVGNRSRDLQNTAGGAGSNINLVPPGAMLSASNPGGADPNKFRPLQGYGDLNKPPTICTAITTAATSWAHHTRLYTMQSNYSWQKALGIVSPTVDPFNLSANYNVLADRPPAYLQCCLLD